MFPSPILSVPSWNLLGKPSGATGKLQVDNIPVGNSQPLLLKGAINSKIRSSEQQIPVVGQSLHPGRLRHISSIIVHNNLTQGGQSLCRELVGRLKLELGDEVEEHLAVVGGLQSGDKDQRFAIDQCQCLQQLLLSVTILWKSKFQGWWVRVKFVEENRADGVMSWEQIRRLKCFHQ